MAIFRIAQILVLLILDGCTLVSDVDEYSFDGVDQGSDTGDDTGTGGADSTGDSESQVETDTASDTRTDSDTGTGGDGDTDADGDADADSDTDTDGDTDADTDLCDGVRCDTPPADYCFDEFTLRVFDRLGWCEAGEGCTYGFIDQGCSGGCSPDGCDDDPCASVTCDTPPEPWCDGDILVRYETPGWCADIGCEYAEIREPCPDGCVFDHCADPPGGVEWMLLEGGEFTMGSPAGEGDSSESPAHVVSVPAFEILRTEVTVEQFRACVDAESCMAPDATACNAEDNYSLSGRGDHPVNCVARRDAMDFCQWLGARLPSEAEWEYAARSAGHPLDYPWGNAPATCDLAVMENENGPGCGGERPRAVCSLPAGNTPQGLCDMAGNVREWVADSWHDSYDIDNDDAADAPLDGAAWLSGDPDEGVVRGGGFGDDGFVLRTAHRLRLTAGRPELDTGFRCTRGVVVLEGKVRRTAGLPLAGAGVGSLCVVVWDMCPSDGVTSVAEFARRQLNDVNLTLPTDVAFFSISLPSDAMSTLGYVLGAWFRQDGDTCEPAPVDGDLITYDGIGIADTNYGCSTFDFNGPFTEHDLYLNKVVMDGWTLPL